ncbi:MAG: hypothetical protein P8X79_18660, partial [Reinekea sp.]
WGCPIFCPFFECLLPNDLRFGGLFHVLFPCGEITELVGQQIDVNNFKAYCYFDEVIWLSFLWCRVTTKTRLTIAVAILVQRMRILFAFCSVKPMRISASYPRVTGTG